MRGGGGCSAASLRGAAGIRSANDHRSSIVEERGWRSWLAIWLSLAPGRAGDGHRFDSQPPPRAWAGRQGGGEWAGRQGGGAWE